MTGNSHVNRPTDRKGGIARENVRSRKANFAAPPLARSKRNRSANQEDRTEDMGGRKSRAPKPIR